MRLKIEGFALPNGGKEFFLCPTRATFDTVARNLAPEITEFVLIAGVGLLMYNPPLSLANGLAMASAALSDNNAVKVVVAPAKGKNSTEYTAMLVGVDAASTAARLLALRSIPIQETTVRILPMARPTAAPPRPTAAASVSPPAGIQDQPLVQAAYSRVGGPLSLVEAGAQQALVHGLLNQARAAAAAAPPRAAPAAAPPQGAAAPAPAAVNQPQPLPVTAAEERLMYTGQIVALEARVREQEAQMRELLDRARKTKAENIARKRVKPAARVVHASAAAAAAAPDLTTPAPASENPFAPLAGATDEVFTDRDLVLFEEVPL